MRSKENGRYVHASEIVAVCSQALAATGARTLRGDARQAGLLVVEVVGRRVGIELGRAGGRRGVVEEVARLATVKVERGADTLSASRWLDVVAAVLRAREVVARPWTRRRACRRGARARCARRPLSLARRTLNVQMLVAASRLMGADVSQWSHARKCSRCLHSSLTLSCCITRVFSNYNTVDSLYSGLLGAKFATIILRGPLFERYFALRHAVRAAT